jgi:hypothetical protein
MCERYSLVCVLTVEGRDISISLNILRYNPFLLGEQNNGVYFDSNLMFLGGEVI